MAQSKEQNKLLETNPKHVDDLPDKELKITTIKMPY